MEMFAYDSEYKAPLKVVQSRLKSIMQNVEVAVKTQHPISRPSQLLF